MTATFTISQPTGAGAGSPGEARRDLWMGQQVLLTAVDVSPGGYEWEFMPGGIPPGSTATLSNANTQQASFTPDLAGSYRVRLIWNGGGPNRVSTKVIRVTKDNTGVATKRGWGFPAFDERPDETNYSGNARGYTPEFELIFEDLLANAFGGGGGPTGTAGGDLAGTYPAPVVARVNGAYMLSSGMSLTAGKYMMVPSGLTDIKDISAIPGDTLSSCIVTRKGSNDFVIYQKSGTGEFDPFLATTYAALPSGFKPVAATGLSTKAYVIAESDLLAGTSQLLKYDIVTKATDLQAAIPYIRINKLMVEPSSGTLWAMDGTANAYKINTTTFAVTVVALPTGLSTNDMFEAGGFVYYCGNGGLIWRVDPSTNAVTTGSTGGYGVVYGGGGDGTHIWVGSAAALYRCDATTLAVDGTQTLATPGDKILFQSNLGANPEYLYVSTNSNSELQLITAPRTTMTLGVTFAMTDPSVKLALNRDRLAFFSSGEKIASLVSTQGGDASLSYQGAAGAMDFGDIESHAVYTGAVITGPATVTIPATISRTPIQVVLADSDADVIDVILPLADPGMTIIVKEMSALPSGTTVTAAGGVTIDGAPSMTLIVPHQSYTFFRGPTEWSVI